MLSTTDAIVLSLQPYSDRAHMLHAYTRAYGRVNYKVYGLGRKHAIGLYTPLSLIRITASYPVSGMPTIKETTTNTPSIGNSPFATQTVRLFISEVLYHVLRHPMPDEPMFDFLAQAVEELNATDEPQNFHIRFLIGLAAMLGFGMEQEPPIPATRNERQQTLRNLCAYFEKHVETWEEPKSLYVLMEVFD